MDYEELKDIMVREPGYFFEETEGPCHYAGCNPYEPHRELCRKLFMADQELNKMHEEEATALEDEVLGMIWETHPRIWANMAASGR